MTSKEVVGYYDALEVILDNYADIEISERYIQQLHGILLKHSEKDQAHRGKYKTSSNKVVAIYPDGTQRGLFDPTPATLNSARDAATSYMVGKDWQNRIYIHW